MHDHRRTRRASAPIELKLSETTRLRRLSRDAIYKEDARQLVVPIPRGQRAGGVPRRASSASCVPAERGWDRDAAGRYASAHVKRLGAAGAAVLAVLAASGCGAVPASGARPRSRAHEISVDDFERVLRVVVDNDELFRHHRRSGDGHRAGRPGAQRAEPARRRRGHRALPGRLGEAITDRRPPGVRGPARRRQPGLRPARRHRAGRRRLPGRPTAVAPVPPCRARRCGRVRGRAGRPRDPVRAPRAAEHRGRGAGRARRAGRRRGDRRRSPPSGRRRRARRRPAGRCRRPPRSTRPAVRRPGAFGATSSTAALARRPGRRPSPSERFGWHVIEALPYDDIAESLDALVRPDRPAVAAAAFARSTSTCRSTRATALGPATGTVGALDDR